jgi:hypothetical protein
MLPGEDTNRTPSLDKSPPRPELANGDAVWYWHCCGKWLEGTITDVDLAVDPPSYQVLHLDCKVSSLTERAFTFDTLFEWPPK